MRTIELGSETAADLVASLRSTTCPMCGGDKRPRITVCLSCWRKLPRSFQGPLYRGVGDGYEEAFRRALLGLAVYRMFMPTEADQ